MTGEELDAETREELRSLPKELATVVSRHLVMAGRLVDEDPETAYLHVKTARRLASRVAVVREGCGVAAYQTGRWAEALAELRAARRLSGREAYLPILADCERGLGRPERALSLARSAEAERLDKADRIELRIVESGARRDMGQYDAAVVTLQVPELKETRLRPWSARLFYAYAEALNAAGREEEARDWFARAAAADRDGDTDAAERYAELEGLEIIDTEEDEDITEELDIDRAGETPANDTSSAEANHPAPDPADADSTDPANTEAPGSADDEAPGSAGGDVVDKKAAMLGEEGISGEAVDDEAVPGEEGAGGDVVDDGVAVRVEEDFGGEASDDEVAARGEDGADDED